MIEYSLCSGLRTVLPSGTGGIAAFYSASDRERNLWAGRNIDKLDAFRQISWITVQFHMGHLPLPLHRNTLRLVSKLRLAGSTK